MRASINLFIAGVLLLFPITVQGQFQFSPKHDIPVNWKGNDLTLPWSGGLNSPQLQTMDLDQDGVDDLVIFDRTSSKISTFLQSEGKYRYAPEYEYFFPEDISNWLVLADYNCDGKKDIFTNALLGMKVYQNNTVDQLSWELITDPLLTQGTNGLVNLQVNESDYPSINDIDGDGDLDILVFNFFAGDRIDLHLNRSIEENGDCSRLEFERVDRHWGQLEECECGVYAFNTECEDLIDSRITRTNHVGGKALLTLDNDGDGDMDLLFGDEFCEELVFFENNGDSEFAVFEEADLNFPDLSTPAKIKYFPAGYYEDVNFDGVKDLIVAPSTSENIGLEMDFQNSVILFANIGTNINPTFEFQQNNFLQSESLDFGESASPIFLDMDGDGDQDILISERGTATPDGLVAKIYFLENTGNPSSASFVLADDDFLDLSNERWFNMHLFLADENNDGKKDLIITANNEEKSVSKFITVLYNNSSSPSGYQFDLNLENTLSFSPLFNENMYFYDLNQDGNLDFLLGKPTGRIEHYENDGSGNFEMVNNAFLEITDDTFKRNPSMFISDLNGDNSPEFIVGDGTGILKIYDDLFNNQGIEHEDLIYNPIQKSPIPSRFGKNVSFAFADLNQDRLPEMIIGTAQGGLQLFENESNRTIPGNEDQLNILAYPVPAFGKEQITIETNKNINLSLFSLLGQKVHESTNVNSGTPYRMDVRGLSNGVYVLKAIHENQEHQLKILIQK